MIKLLTSKKFKLPTLFLVTDRSDIKQIAVGIPFIYSDIKMESYIVRLLEFEILYQAAIRSGLPFNFKQILIDNGYRDLQDFGAGSTTYMDYSTSEYDEELVDLDIEYEFIKDTEEFKRFCLDASCYVDPQKLKDLKVFPIWLDSIEKAIETNIHNFAIYNDNMYNKKLEGMYGALEFKSPNRNLIINDISGSMPKAISMFILTHSKNMAETYYCDVMITGTITIMIPYEEIHTMDVEDIYTKVGRNNEGDMFKAFLSEEKHYKTAIVFGDNDHPGGYMKSGYISDSEGKKLCKWKVDKIISFHREGIDYLAGYARWFDVIEENIQRVDKWVKYLN